MPVLFGLLAMLCVIGILLGLIKPTLVLRWGTKRTRLRAVGWYFLFLVGCVIGGVSTTPQNENQGQPTTPQTTASAPLAKETTKEAIKQHDDNIREGTNGNKGTKLESKNTGTSNALFDFSLKTFIKRYNDEATILGQATIVQSKSIDKNDKSGKVYTLTTNGKNVAFTVTTNNDGVVKESIMIGAGDGTTEGVTRILMGMASYFNVFDPEITKTGRKEILKGLGMLSSTIPDKSTFTRKNVKYMLLNIKGVGLWLTAQPAS